MTSIEAQSPIHSAVQRIENPPEKNEDLGKSHSIPLFNFSPEKACRLGQSDKFSQFYTRYKSQAQSAIHSISPPEHEYYKIDNSFTAGQIF